jgi:hypothetical protein
MNPQYRVRTVPALQVEATINAAAQEGWHFVTAYAARFAYGLGGEYAVREVEIVLQHAPLDGPGPALSLQSESASP